jgi:hypothetical protein
VFYEEEQQAIETNIRGKLEAQRRTRDELLLSQRW